MAPLPEPEPEQTPAEGPTGPDGAAAGQPRRGWFSGHESAETSPETGTDQDSAADKPVRVKQQIKELTRDGVNVATRAVHWLLAAHDPAQRSAGVWIADAEQAARIAEPAARLLSAAVPPALLQTRIVNLLQLGLALGHYVTDHLALREQTRSRPGTEVPLLDHTGGLS